MRAIDADALYRKVKTECNPYGKPSIGFEDGKKVLEWIENVSTIEPEPQKGEWISEDVVFGGVPYQCSNCGEKTRDTIMGKPRWKFCPMCGADMRGGQDEDD